MVFSREHSQYSVDFDYQAEEARAVRMSCGKMGVPMLALLSALVVISYVRPSCAFGYRLSNTASSPWNRFVIGTSHRLPSHKTHDKRNFIPLLLGRGRHRQHRPPMAPLPIGRRSPPPPPIAGSGQNPWNSVDAYDDDVLQSSYPGMNRGSRS